MPFSIKGFLCGTDPNKTNITNAITLNYQSYLSSKVETLINSITDVVNSEVTNNTDKIFNQNITKLSNSGTIEINGGTFEDNSITNVQINNFNDNYQTESQTFLSNPENMTNIINNIKTQIEADMKNSIDTAANITAASELSNMDESKTSGELNNLINKVSGLFDYQTTDTTINNSINHTFDNHISTKILSTINDTDKIKNLFEFNADFKVNDNLLNSLNNTEIVKLSNVTVKDRAILNINITSVNKNYVNKIVNYIFKPLNNANFTTNIDKTIDTATTQKITQKVTISSVLKTTNTKKEETTSIIDSLLNMIMYVGIAVVVLVIVLAVVGGIILLMKKKKNGTQGEASSDITDDITSAVNTASSIKTSLAPLKSSNPIKVPKIPTKRIPGLPKF